MQIVIGSCGGGSDVTMSIVVALIGAAAVMAAAYLQKKHGEQALKLEYAKEFSNRLADAMESAWALCLDIEGGIDVPLERKDQAVIRSLWLPADVTHLLVKVVNLSQKDIASAKAESRMLRSALLDLSKESEVNRVKQRRIGR